MTNSNRDSAGENPSVLGVFSIFLGEWRKLLLALFGASVPAWVTGLGFGLGPPWPYSWQTSLLITLLNGIVLMFAFTYWQGLAEGRLRTIIGRLSLAAGITVAAYLLLFAFFVFDAPDWQHREAMGIWYQPWVREVLSDPRSMETESDLLAGYAFDSEKIWTANSVKFIRVALLTNWLILFACLAGLASSFLLRQEKRKSAGKGQTWGGLAIEAPKARQKSRAHTTEPADAPMTKKPRKAKLVAES